MLAEPLFAALALFVVIACCCPAVVLAAAGVDANLATPLKAALKHVTVTAPTPPSGGTSSPSQPRPLYPWQVTLFGRPSEATPPTYVTVPALAAPVCVAYNSAATVLLQLSLADLASMLTTPGYAGNIAAPSSNAVVPASSLRFVLSRSAASSALLLSVLRAQVPAFAAASAANNGSWPASALANAAVQWVPGSDDDVLAAARARINVVTVAPLAYAPGLPCAQVRVQDPYTRESIVTRPTLGSAAGSLFTVDFAADPPLVAAQSGTYPLVGAVYVSIATAAACGDVADAALFLSKAFSDAATLATLLPWGFARFDQSVQLAATASLFKAACAPAPSFAASGSTAILLAAAAWSTAYLQANNVFANYASVGSGAGLSALAAGTSVIAASDTLYTSAQRAANPSVRFLPAVGFAVSIVFNLPNIDSLVVPPCALLGMFNGTVRFWDDAAVVAANPATAVPRVAVSVVGRSGSSGTTGILMGGLAQLAAFCGASAAPYTATTTTFASYAANVSGLSYRLASSNNALVGSVAGTFGALGYAAQPETLALRSNALSLVDPATGQILSASPSYVAAAMATSAFDEATGALSFSASTATYPFVGVTYFAYRTDVQAASCAAAAQAMDWMFWAVQSGAAAATAAAQSYVVPPANVTARAVATAKASLQCGGQRLYPTASDAQPFPVYAPIVAVLAVLVPALAFAAFRLYRHAQLMHVPLDDSAPFTAMFVSIKNLPELRDASETATAAAVKQFAGIVRGAVKAHECYAVHRLNDGTFFVVAKDPLRALKCASAILLETEKARWTIPRPRNNLGDSRSSDGTGRTSMQVKPRVVDAHDHGGSQSRRSLQSGDDYLRPLPHVGIHHDAGHIVRGDEGDAKPSGYEGFVVEAAALIADAASGGQIALSTSAWDVAVAADDAAGELNAASVTPIASLTARDMARLANACDTALASSLRSRPPIAIISYRPAGLTPVTAAAVARRGAGDRQLVGADDGSYGVAAALNDKKLGVATRRVAVAVVHIPALERASAAGDDRAAVARAEAALEMIQEAAQSCRVRILTVVDGTITVIADSANVPNPGLQAALIAYHCAVELPEIDRVLSGASAGVAAGFATVGKVRGADVLLGNIASAAADLQRVAAEGQLQCVAFGSCVSDSAVASRLRCCTVDCVATSGGAVERLVVITDVVAEADADLDDPTWLYASVPNLGAVVDGIGGATRGAAGSLTVEQAWSALARGETVRVTDVAAEHRHPAPRVMGRGAADDAAAAEGSSGGSESASGGDWSQRCRERLAVALSHGDGVLSYARRRGQELGLRYHP